jgi:uncharacterized protein
MRPGAPRMDVPLLLARLGGELRAHGVGTSLRDEIDAAAALPLVDLGDREEVRLALRIALKVPRPAWDTFDRLLGVVFYGAGSERAPRHAAVPPALREGRLLAWDPEARRMKTARDDAAPAGAAEDGEPAFSPVAMLRRRSFDGAWAGQDVAEMERLLARLARRLAAHRGRRLTPASTLARGRVDLRRSYRRALRTSGELLGFARQQRAADQPRLVFLCDTSGSMDAHTRFMLTFVLCLRRAVPRAELFAFNTELVRLTPHLARAPGRTDVVLEHLGTLVPDWSGGTRIGACLEAFVSLHMPRVVDPATVVIILSDGLDRGDPDVLAGAVRSIQARARRLVWLNPLAGDARYEPAARGMRAALPFVDHFASAHNLESLERLLPHLWG